MPYIEEVLNNSLERVGIDSDTGGRRVQKGVESFVKSKSVKWHVLDIVHVKCCPRCMTALLKFNITDNVMELRINGTEDGTICKCIALLPGCMFDRTYWDFDLRIDGKPDVATRLHHAISLDLLRP
jgi:hypothetical protein